MVSMCREFKQQAVLCSHRGGKKRKKDLLLRPKDIFQNKGIQDENVASAKRTRETRPTAV